MTSPASPTDAADRHDATVVLQRLRDAGHEAFFAGGCVRDLLLGRQPKDWDVATNATPDRVRQLFPRSQAVGAAFGVILVRQHNSQIEVATFRSDGQYVDGRHPSNVNFTDARHDAFRRDFTINGLFLDPVEDRVIDFVGGRDDLAAGVIRAIGDPARRFGEDYLRMLRAVRFAARLGFAIEPGTAAAIRQFAPLLTRISPERIADELRTMLPPRTRLQAWRLLHDLGLAQVVFRFVETPTGPHDERRPSDGLFGHLPDDGALPFATALSAAALQWRWWATPAGTPLQRCFDRPAATQTVQALRKALRLSNDESEAIAATLIGLSLLTTTPTPRLAAIKRFLATPTAPAARTIAAALAAAGEIDAAAERTLQAQLSELEQTEFAPPPLVTGDDLTAAGCQPGPTFKRMLDGAYDAQLEGRVLTKEEALAFALQQQ